MSFDKTEPVARQAVATLVDTHVDIEPKQVEDVLVEFVPFTDFTARINQDDFSFRKDIPTRVTRDQANIYLEAKKGYVK